MPNFNQVTIIGHAGRDAVEKNINGKRLVEYSVATSYKTKRGEKETEWHKVAYWSDYAPLCSKGQVVCAFGRLKTEKYTDKTGCQRSDKSIVASNVIVGDKQDFSHVQPAQDNSVPPVDPALEQIPF